MTRRRAGWNGWPKAYLDDITTKNLLVHNGRLSGIIDIDWIGIGDRGTQVMDKTVEVNQEIVDRLNGIYDSLWEELQSKLGKERKA